MLEHYAQILPGGVEWILTQTEKQLTHRHALETKKLDSDIARERTGQWLAFVLSLVVLGAGSFLIYTGRSTAAGVGLIAADLVGLAAVFIHGRRTVFKELQEKRDGLDRSMRGG